MASGAYERKVGQDHNLAIAQTTVSKYLGQVLTAINRQYVKKSLLIVLSLPPMACSGPIMIFHENLKYYLT